MKRLLRLASSQKLEFEILYGFSTERELPKYFKSKDEIVDEMAELVVEKHPFMDLSDTKIDIMDSINDAIKNRLDNYVFRDMGFKEDYPESGEVLGNVIIEIRSDVNKFTLEYSISDDSKAEICKEDLIKELSEVFGVVNYSEPDAYLIEHDGFYIAFTLKLK